MLHDLTYNITANLWVYQGPAAWYFITLPKDVADEIKFFTSEMRRGWGSVRVEVTIGTSRWKTSIFPAKESGSYVLPVKKEVRKAEKITTGDAVSFSLKVIS